MKDYTLREKIVDAIAGTLSRKAGWTVLVTSLFIGFFAAHLPQVRAVNDNYDFSVDRDPATEYFKRFQKIFDKEEFFVIAYRQEDLFTQARLSELKTLTDSLQNLDNVVDVVSLANAAYMRGTEDSFEADDFLKEIPTTPEGLSALRHRAVTHPLYRKTLISEDGKTTAIVIFTPSHGPHSEKNVEELTRHLLSDVRKILKPYEDRGTRFALAGWPVTAVYMSSYMEADARMFFPLSFILTMGTIWYVFKNLRLFLMAGAGIGLTLVATLGLAGMAKIPINNASVAAIPLIMALALSDLIHLFSHLDQRVLEESGGDRKRALGLVLRSVLFPCLLTSVNTGIGFFSFTFNRVPAVRSFGWLASSGMLFEFIVTFGLVAPMLTYFKAERVYRDAALHEKRSIPTMIRVLHETVGRRPWFFLTLCLPAIGLSAWFARDIRINTNLEKHFRQDSPIRRDIDFVRNNFAGIDLINVVFESSRDRFKDPAVLGKIDALADIIEADPRVDTVTGFADYLKEMNKAFHAENPAEYRLPSNQKMVEQYLLLYGRNEIEDYSTAAFDTTRLMIQAQVPDSDEARDLLKRIRKILDDHPLPGVRMEITGGTALGVRTMKVMVDDQVNNIGQTVIVIWLIMVGVLGSWGLSLLFLVPNLFPIVINFGIMGYFGIPLDTGTSLIAASAFGIIVDDTVHFFVAYSQRRREGCGVSLALRETSLEKGETSVSSFMIMFIAFGVLTLSHFQPIYYFGLLNMMILMVGLIGDQILLKSLLILWARWKEGRTLGFASK